MLQVAVVQNRLARRWRQIVIRKKTWYTAECVTRQTHEDMKPICFIG